MLDEVDAPLDEANVGRFAALVQKMKADTQFIVITHQKPTMVAADTLYGVTMEEAGCSRLVSVQLREAENWCDEKCECRESFRPRFARCSKPFRMSMRKKAENVENPATESASNTTTLIIYLSIENNQLDMTIFMCSMPGKSISALDLGAGEEENPQAFPHTESENP